MSRRIKLIIAALFLVLLIIPTVYVVLTWAPAHPLEARLILRPSPAEDTGSCPFAVELKNTTLVPVYAVIGGVSLPTTANYLTLKVGVYGPGDLTASPIRPGEVRVCEAYYTQEHSPSLPLTDAVVELTWTTETRLRAYEAAVWLVDLAPSILEDRIPLPDTLTTTTPLLQP